VQTKNIEIDLELSKTIEGLRLSFEETENEILKRVLTDHQSVLRNRDRKEGGLRVRDGVFLTAGTKLRHIAKRSGRRYDAEVVDGGIKYQDQLYHSPSMAAIGATNTHRNGWVFWEFQNPVNGEWQLLDYLRRGLPGVTI